MALFVQQNDERSKLQQQVANNLQERAKNQELVNDNTPDGVNDTEYIKDTKPTTSLAWLWLLIVIFAIGIFTWLTFFSSSR
jgi:hypothetical protein